jgi:hypothetical protein
VWAAVRVLSDAASSLPLHVYRKTADGRERVTSGKLVDLLDRPGPATSQADLVSSLMAHLAIWGNAYLAKYRQAGEVTQLDLLAPERIRPELEGGKLRFRYTPPAGSQRIPGGPNPVAVSKTGSSAFATPGGWPGGVGPGRGDFGADRLAELRVRSLGYG